MRKPPSVQLPALFVRLPVATHDLLRDLAATADESVSRYIVTLIEQQRVGGPQLPPRRPRKVVAPQPVEVASDAPVKRKRGRPRKVPLAEVIVATPPRKRHARVPLETTPAVDAAPVEEPFEQQPVAAPTSSRTDTLDRIRAALARLEEPLVEELADESASRVVVEDAP